MATIPLLASIGKVLLSCSQKHMRGIDAARVVSVGAVMADKYTIGYGANEKFVGGMMGSCGATIEPKCPITIFTQIAGPYPAGTWINGAIDKSPKSINCRNVFLLCTPLTATSSRTKSPASAADAESGDENRQPAIIANPLNRGIMAMHHDLLTGTGAESGDHYIPGFAILAENAGEYS